MHAQKPTETRAQPPLSAIEVESQSTLLCFTGAKHCITFYLSKIITRNVFSLANGAASPIPFGGAVIVYTSHSAAQRHPPKTEFTRGACLRALQPSRSSVKHASHGAKAYRNRTRSETRRGGGGALSGERHHAKIMCHKNTSSPVQEAYSLGARLT